MKEHYYSNFKGCLGTRTHLDSLDGSLASILAPPSIHVLSLFLSLSLLFHVTLSVVRGCPSEPFKFRTRLLLSRCHFISTTWTKIHGRKYSPFELTQCPRYRQLFRIHTPPPLSLSFSAPKFKFASRRSQKGVHLVRARNEGGGERSRRISGALVA